MRILAVAPRHLGDGVMALPALAALARLGALTIRAPAWGVTLYRDLPAEVGGREDADVAVVFPPSVRAAWSVRAVRRRIGVGRAMGLPGVPTADLFLRRPLLTEHVDEGQHRSDTYARLAGAVGARVEGPPCWSPRATDPEVDVPEGHVGLNPVAQAGATRAWRGWAELAERLPGPVVFYAGPGEAERLVPWSGSWPARPELSLPAFGRALQRCRVFVSNDTGAAHFARACGVPTVVIHGSTTAARTGPAGAIALEGPDPGCRPCYRDTCPIGVPCLAIPVAQVRDAAVAVSR